MRRLALYGGTFDPFHLAHRAVVEGLLKSDRFSRIYVMPAGDPPHKVMEGKPPIVYRYAMVHAGLQDLRECLASGDRLQISDYEILNTGRSYTVKTLAHLQASDPAAEIHFIGGSDVLHEITTWFRPGDIMAQAHLSIIQRPGYATDTDRAQVEMLQSVYGASIHFLEIDTPDISSGGIRRAIAAGEKLGGLMLPQKVADFIVKHALYRSGRSYPELSSLDWRTMWEEQGWRAVLEVAEARDRLAGYRADDAVNSRRENDGKRRKNNVKYR